MCRPILKVSCQQYTNLVSFILWLIIICSDGKQVFFKKGQLLSFIDNYFKGFVDKLFIKCPQLIALENKTLVLLLPYLGEISL